MSSDDMNRHQQYTTNGGGKQQQDNADCLFDEFGGSDFLDAGLKAIERGWKIFPCNGKKQPLTDHGFKDATTNEVTTRAWAKQYPGALWGYALPENIVVIDLDMKRGKNGIREFEKFQLCKPEEFEAPRVATATGGNHIYADATGRDFQNTRDKIALGVDTRTDGGYVIIPSGPQSGYRWLTDPDTPLPPTPEWAEVALRKTSNLEVFSRRQGVPGLITIRQRHPGERLRSNRDGSGWHSGSYIKRSFFPDRTLRRWRTVRARGDHRRSSGSWTTDGGLSTRLGMVRR